MRLKILYQLGPGNIKSLHMIHVVPGNAAEKHLLKQKKHTCFSFTAEQPFLKTLLSNMDLDCLMQRKNNSLHFFFFLELHGTSQLLKKHVNPHLFWRCCSMTSMPLPGGREQHPPETVGGQYQTSFISSWREHGRRGKEKDGDKAEELESSISHYPDRKISVVFSSIR